MGELNMENLPQVVKNVIEHVSLDEIKKALYTEFTDGYEFSEMKYTEGKQGGFTLYAKIAEIMGELDRIPKSGYNKQFNYNYVTESDVVGSVRPLMAKHKLVMIPEIRRYKVEEFKGKYNSMQIGTIEIRWNVIDGESGEKVTFTMVGKGVDNLEKDIYKAITGNKKYALITLFMIDSGDDPERSDTPTDAPQNNNYQQSNRSQGTGHAQNRSNNQNGTNTPPPVKNTTEGQRNANTTPPNKPVEEPKVKQPTKGDLLTRWIVLATGADDGKSKKDIRAEFDAWYKKKSEEQWDHITMMQVLTKKLHEKNQKENNGQADGQPGQE